MDEETGTESTEIAIQNLGLKTSTWLLISHIPFSATSVTTHLQAIGPSTATANFSLQSKTRRANTGIVEVVIAAKTTTYTGVARKKDNNTTTLSQ